MSDKNILPTTVKSPKEEEDEREGGGDENNKEKDNSKNADDNNVNGLNALRKFMMSRSREAGNLTKKRSLLLQIGQWSQEEHAEGSPSWQLREKAVAAGVLDAGFHSSLGMREVLRFEIWTNPYVALKLADLYQVYRDSSITLPPNGTLQEFLDFMKKAEKRMHENLTIDMLSTKATRQNKVSVPTVTVTVSELAKHEGKISGKAGLPELDDSSINNNDDDNNNNCGTDSNVSNAAAIGKGTTSSNHRQMQEFSQRLLKLEMQVGKMETIISSLNKTVKSRKRSCDNDDTSEDTLPKRQRKLQDFHQSIFEDLLLCKEDEVACPIHCAVQYGNRKQIEEIVNGTNVRWLNGLDSKGRTAVDFAALTGQLDVVQLLRSKGAGFRSLDPERQEIMMEHARRRSHFVDSYLQYARSKQNKDNKSNTGQGKG